MLLDKLRDQNTKLLYISEKNNDQSAISKHLVIKELLKFDNCFQRLSIEEARTILETLKVTDWKQTYAQLLIENKKQ